MMPEKIWANRSPYFLPSGQLSHIGYWWEEPAKDADPYVRADLVPQWISVEDRLPEDGIMMLVYLGAGAHEEAMLDDGRWKNVDGYFRPQVTHWMPLPQPPKEEK